MFTPVQKLSVMNSLENFDNNNSSNNYLTCYAHNVKEISNQS